MTTAPLCDLCSDTGEVPVPVGPRDRDGNQHVEYPPCSCAAGDQVAANIAKARRELRDHLDVLSRAALAPAPPSSPRAVNARPETRAKDDQPRNPNTATAAPSCGTNPSPPEGAPSLTDPASLRDGQHRHDNNSPAVVAAMPVTAGASTSLPGAPADRLDLAAPRRRESPDV